MWKSTTAEDLAVAISNFELDKNAPDSGALEKYATQSIQRKLQDIFERSVK